MSGGCCGKPKPKPKQPELPFPSEEPVRQDATVFAVAATASAVVNVPGGAE